MNYRAILLIGAVLAASPAYATSYSFIYASTSGDAATGSGVFSTNAIGAISLSGLTSFSYSEYLPAAGANAGFSVTPSIPDFVATQANLSHFSANISASGVTSLTLTTSLSPGAHYTLGVYAPGPVSFVITSIGTDGGSTKDPANIDTGNVSGPNLIVPSAVPEPASWAMTLVGFGLVGFIARARRQKLRITYA